MISTAVHCNCQNHPRDPPLRTKSLSSLQELIPSHAAVKCAQPEIEIKVTLPFMCRFSSQSSKHVTKVSTVSLIMLCVMLINDPVGDVGC